MASRGISALAGQLHRRRTESGCRSFFITGTDTGVGKTAVACALIRELRRRDVAAAGFKPICCGDRQDAVRLQAASDHAVSLDLINPVHFPLPLAPIAQKGPPWNALMRRISKAFAQLTGSNIEILLVEGAGGWLCPIRPTKTMCDLAGRLKTPVVLVARDRLGVLNHTLLTLAAIQTAKLDCVGLVLTRFGQRDGLIQKTTLTTLKHWTRLPVFVVEKLAKVQ